MITSPGIGSGLDISSLVSQLVAAEGEPTLVRLGRREASAQAELSGLGQLKGALSGLQSSLAALRDSSTFSRRAASSSDPEVFTASASGAAVAGSYGVEVVRLAAAHKLASTGYADPGGTVGSGQLTITSGTSSAQVTIAPGADTLADVRDAINAKTGETGVSATIVTVDDGVGGSESKLLLTARETGEDNAITVTVVDDDGNHVDANGLSALTYDTGAGVTHLAELQAALDSEIRVDTQTVTRPSNVVGDAIEGVTLDLVSAPSGNKETLTIALDSAAANAAVNDFVTRYNSLRATINNLSLYDPATGVRGVLLGDAGLLSISTRLQRELSAVVPGTGGAFDSLSRIGVSTQADGALAIDASELAAALASDPESVSALFSSDDGLATRLDGIVGDLVGSGGALDSRTSNITTRIEDIDESRAALDRRLSALEGRLLAQFTAMDTLIGQLRSTSDFLTQQLAVVQAASSRR